MPEYLDGEMTIMECEAAYEMTLRDETDDMMAMEESDDISEWERQKASARAIAAPFRNSPILRDYFNY